MNTQKDHLPRCRIGDMFAVPTPDNENLPLLDADFPLTPAELMQWARRKKSG